MTDWDPRRDDLERGTCFKVTLRSGDGVTVPITQRGPEGPTRTRLRGDPAPDEGQCVIHVVADNTRHVATMFPEALRIEHVGVGYVPLRRRGQSGPKAGALVGELFQAYLQEYPCEVPAPAGFMYDDASVVPDFMDFVLVSLVGSLDAQELIYWYDRHRNQLDDELDRARAAAEASKEEREGH